MMISKDVLDELLGGVKNADDLPGDQGLMKELKIRLMERVLGAELTEHLGYELDAEPANQQSNRRNGTSRKTLVMNNLRNRGVEDILIAVVDGLKGFPDAINAAFPDTTVQTCIVHPVCHSLNFCGWKDRKIVAKDLKRIYQCYR